MAVDNFEKYEQLIKRDGYFVLKLEHTDALHETRVLLTQKLRELTRQPELELENYHKLNYTDEEHLAFQYQISEYFKENNLAINIIKQNVRVFKSIIGQDLDVQAKPYLRIARPQKKVDNIGYHRDTFYGGYPEELSVVIPYVNLSKEAALSIYPGSHTHPESNFTFDQKELATKEQFKKSVKHTLGFLYAPKQLKDEKKYNIQPVPLKFGEALVFMLSTLHGSVVNTSNECRWSSDVRIKHALNNLDLSSRPSYYAPLCRSALTECCAQFYTNNSSN